MKKQNKRSKLTRITLALLLILSMIGNTLILPAVAQESLTPTDETILPETPLDGTSDATGAATLPEPIQLTAADIPEFISAAALTERGAVERMRSEETNMSSVIFRNADGTRTMYMYGLPVKYTAMDGTVRDKSTNLVSVSAVSALLADRPVAQTVAQMSSAQQTALRAELGILDAERAATTLHMLSTALTTRGKSLSDMAYTTLDNDVYALFPTNLAQGMTLVFGEHSVRMTPAMGMTMTTGGNVTKTTTASLADSDITERLLYPNVFGPGTAVQYTPTLTGVKEEILLSANVGKNSFDFLLETSGLILTETNGQFVLIDPETEQTVGTLGEIIVFDSAGQITRGNMTAQTVKEGEIYGITISVDQEFLASATYPVSIDPTARINPFNQEDTNLIEDVSIYSDPACVNYTFIEYHQIGTVLGNTYRGQAAFRIPALYDPPKVFDDYTFLTSSRVGAVELHVNSMMNTTNSTTLQVFQYGADWISTAKIFGAPYYNNYWISPQDTIVYNVSPNTTVSIDITNYAKEWLDYDQYEVGSSPFVPDQGILLLCDGYPSSVWLESLEYNPGVYVTLDYDDTAAVDYYMNSRYTKTFLAADETSETLEMRNGLVSNIGTSITWNVEYEGNGLYSLHPNGQDDIYLDMWGDFTTVQSYQTMWSRSIAQGGGIIWSCDDDAVLAVDEDGEVIVEYPDRLTVEQKAWRMIQTDSYIELKSNHLSTNPIWIAPEEEITIYSYLSQLNSHFSEISDFTYSITPLVVTHANGSIVGKVPNGNDVIVFNHIPTGQTINVYICVTFLKEGHYFLQNGHPLPNMFIQLDDDATNFNADGVDLETWPFNGEKHQEWILTRVYEDYYSVISAKSGKALSVRANSVNSDLQVLVQEVYSGMDRQLWKFDETSNGTYVVRPKSAKAYSTDWCMSVSLPGHDEAKIVQEPYVPGDESMKDEWILAYVETSLDVELEGQQKDTWCWAASARMFAKHYYPNVTRTQSEAVDSVLGNLPDWGGSTRQAMWAVEYYIGNIYGASLNLQYSLPEDLRIYSEYNLLRFLDDGHVVFVGRNYYVNGEHRGGHAIVIAGYVSITVNGETQYRYIIYDPWPSPKPSPWDTQQTTEGQKYLRSYQWICNSNKSSSNYDNPDNGVWVGYVTVVTEYSDESIPSDLEQE